MNYMMEGERVVLRHWRREDAEALFRYASDPRVSELALWPTHTSKEMSREVIESYFMPNPDLFAIVLKRKTYHPGKSPNPATEETGGKAAEALVGNPVGGSDSEPDRESDSEPDGEPVGCIGLVPEGEEHHRCDAAEREVGYWIGRPFWGMGYTTEALMALINYCRETLRLSALTITADAGNAASRRVAEKCGFKLVEEYDFEGIPSVFYRLPL